MGSRIVLTDVEALVASYACRHLVAQRDRTGQPVPPAVRQLPARLDELLAASAAGTADTQHDSPLGQWATTNEAAHTLGVTSRRVRQIAGALGGRKIGGNWWIPRDALPEQENTS